MNHFNELMLTLPCAYCKAQPGEHCKTKGGHKVVMGHADRYYATKAKLKEMR